MLGQALQSCKKKENFGRYHFFCSTKSHNLISTSQFTTILTYNILFCCFVGKKIIDFVMRHDTSRGRKSKAGGGEIESDSIIYTPE